MTHLEADIEKFNNLSFDEKSYFVWHLASVLISREVNGLRITLYYLSGFYIQQYYDKNNFKILNIEATDKSCIDDYLNKIELSKLF